MFFDALHTKKNYRRCEFNTLNGKGFSLSYVSKGVTGLFYVCLKIFHNFELKKKGKAVPLQAWSGPEGSRNLRFPDYMTTAQDGGKVVSLTHRPPLPTGNAPGTHFC
jgi:hypothetical protein